MLNVSLDTCLGPFCLDCSFEVPNKGVTAIFGRSGSGKTSLINYISGLADADNGQISLNGRVLLDTVKNINVPTEQRNIGYVFQEPRLFPHYSVKGNLLYGSQVSSQSVEFDQILGLLGLQNLLERKPIHLSGGEKQRVAIGRALLTKPELLLMDEPLASLDAPRKNDLLPYLANLAKEIEIPILYVTHSLDEIVRLADQLILVDQGQIQCSGKVEEVWRDEALRPWLQGDTRSSLLTGTVSHNHERYPMTCVSIDAQHTIWMSELSLEPGQNVRLRVRANDVSITQNRPDKSSIRNILPATIIAMEQDSNRQIEVLLKLGEHHLWSHITAWAKDDLDLKIGNDVYAQIKGISLTDNDWSDH